MCSISIVNEFKGTALVTDPYIMLMGALVDVANIVSPDTCLVQYVPQDVGERCVRLRPTAVVLRMADPLGVIARVGWDSPPHGLSMGQMAG